MKWINYHHLIYFKEIAEKGSISKASQTLKVGQPALSSQLKSLEESLGVKLFERRNKRLFLTEPGKVALEYASQINSLGQELKAVIQGHACHKQLHLSVGSLDSIPKRLICDIVDFAHQKTGCFLSIFEDSIDSLLRQLQAHQIEVIISDHKITTHENEKIFSKKILNRPVVAYASPDFQHLKKKFPQSLENVPCILPTRHSKLRNDIQHFLEVNDIEAKIIAETQDTSLQKILATKGDGVIFLPEFTTEELVLNNSLISLGKLNEVYAEYFLIYGKRIFENPALDLVIKQDFEKIE